jgi:hypothetical protein
VWCVCVSKYLVEGRTFFNPVLFNSFVSALHLKSGAFRLFLRFLDHAQLHTHTHSRAAERAISRPQTPHLHSTQQTHAINIHALSGIRTFNPSNRAASDLRLRQWPPGSADFH